MTWNVTKLDLHMFLYRNNFTCTPAHLQMKHSVSSTDFKVIRHVNLYDVWYEDSIIFMSEIRTSNHKPSHNPKTFSRGFIMHQRLENSPSLCHILWLTFSSLHVYDKFFIQRWSLFQKGWSSWYIFSSTNIRS